MPLISRKKIASEPKHRWNITTVHSPRDLVFFCISRFVSASHIITVFLIGTYAFNIILDLKLKIIKQTPTVSLKMNIKCI